MAALIGARSGSPIAVAVVVSVDAPSRSATRLAVNAGRHSRCRRVRRAGWVNMPWRAWSTSSVNRLTAMTATMTPTTTMNVCFTGMWLYFDASRLNFVTLSIAACAAAFWSSP